MKKLLSLLALTIIFVIQAAQGQDFWEIQYDSSFVYYSKQKYKKAKLCLEKVLPYLENNYKTNPKEDRKSVV